MELLLEKHFIRSHLEQQYTAAQRLLFHFLFRFRLFIISLWCVPTDVIFFIMYVLVKKVFFYVCVAFVILC